MPATSSALNRSCLVFVIALAGCTAPGGAPGPAASASPATQAGVIPATAAAASEAGTGSRRARLARTFADANRITIAPGAGSGEAPAPRDLRGQYLIGEFLELVDIDEVHGPVRIDAPADAVFTLHRGDQVVGTLSLRRLSYLRWENGPWEGDAVLKPSSAARILEWTVENGADIRLAVQKLATDQATRETEDRRRMLANFSGSALAVFGAADNIVYHTRRLRWISTGLPEVITDKATLAETAFRALEARNMRWIEDDWATGALQTVLLEMDPATVEAAMERLAARDTARLGIARVFFRTGLASGLPEAARDRWTERLADAAMRGLPDRDKHALLEFVAKLPGEVPANFLRAVASGERPYSYSAPTNDLAPTIEEPSLRAAAVLLLAERGDRAAAAAISALAQTQPFGPDQAALELSRALLTPGSRPTLTHLRYRSRMLGLASLAVLERLTGSGLPVDILSAAMEHIEGDVSAGAVALAEFHGLQPSELAERPARGEETLDPLIANDHPRRAIETTTELMKNADGRRLAQLQAIRGEAHSQLEDFAAAAVDFLNVDRTPYAEELGIRRRLVWVQWYLGDFDGAEETIAKALGDRPTSELLLLRGLLNYSRSDFGVATEADLVSSLVLDPGDGYPVLFHHLAVSLGGRPSQSLLRARLLGPPLGDEWPRHIMAYLLNAITAERLLELARNEDPAIEAWHLCEANFYIAQAARLAGRTQDERTFLNFAIALNQVHVAEYWLSRYRLEELDSGAGAPAPAPSPRTPAPRIPAPAPAPAPGGPPSAPPDRPPAQRPGAI